MNSMLDLVILTVLLIGAIVGLRRGFILQFIHLTGFFVAFITAYMYYDELAPKLKLWIPFPTMGSKGSFNMIFDTIGLDLAYYNAIAFAAIFFAVKILWQMIGSMLDFIAHFPILKTLNRWGGGVLGLAEVYLIMFILVYIAALLPIEIVQNQIHESFFAQSIVKNTPLFSDKVKDLWFNHMPS
jgi:uncharacterized membrane protein required for colicin V production